MNYVGREPAPAGVMLVGDTNPVGMIGWFHQPPTGWVRLNGTVLTKAGYPDLWIYAQGFLTADQVANPGLYRNIDAATFAVPILDGLFVRGAGQVDATHVSGALGAKQADDNKSHSHTAADGGGFQVTTGGPSYGSSVAGSNSTATTNAVGGPEARPVNVALVPCVKALTTTFVPVTVEAGAYPPGTLAGATLSNNAVDAVNDIDIAAGKCRATGDVANMTLAAMTKQLDAVWALGSAAGMRASGAAIADGTYHVFAIRRPDTGVVDVAADTDPTGANIPVNTNAAFTQRRRLGSILRAAGAIVGFVQTGDEFLRKASSKDVTAVGAFGAAAILRALSVPLGIKVEAIFNAERGNGGSAGLHYFSSPDVNDEVVGGFGVTPLGTSVNNANQHEGSGPFRVRTNAAAQIRSRDSSGGADVGVHLSTLGWIDRRGRDDL